MEFKVEITFSGLIVLRIAGDGSDRPDEARRVQALLVDTSSHGSHHHHYPRLGVPIEAITVGDPTTPEAVHVDTAGRQFAEFSLENTNLFINVPGAPAIHSLRWAPQETEEPEGSEDMLDWVLDLRRLGATQLDRSGVGSTVNLSPGEWTCGDLATDQNSTGAEIFEIVDHANERLYPFQALAEQFVYTVTAQDTIDLQFGVHTLLVAPPPSSGEGDGETPEIQLSVTNLPPVGVIGGPEESEVVHAHLFANVSAGDLPHRRLRARQGGVTISTKWCPSGRWVD